MLISAFNAYQLDNTACLMLIIVDKTWIRFFSKRPLFRQRSVQLEFFVPAKYKTRHFRLFLFSALYFHKNRFLGVELPLIVTLRILGIIRHATDQSSGPLSEEHVWTGWLLMKPNGWGTMSILVQTSGKYWLNVHFCASCSLATAGSENEHFFEKWDRKETEIREKSQSFFVRCSMFIFFFSVHFNQTC